MHKKKNLYLVLDITPQSTQNDILHAYNRAKVTYSRDSLAAYSIYDDNSKESILKEIEDAYLILGDPRKRRAYDISMGYAEGEVGDDLNMHDEAPSSTITQSSISTPTPKVYPKKTLAIAPLLKVEKNPAFEQQIEEMQSLTGSLLRSVRLYRGYTEEQLATLCQLKAEHIVAIEEERPLNLHHPVYLRGHILLICEALQVPRASDLAKTYIQRLQTENKISRSTGTL